MSQCAPNRAAAVPDTLSRDQPVPRDSKRRSLHQTQGGSLCQATSVYLCLPVAGLTTLSWGFRQMISRPDRSPCHSALAL
jgi:hypothetical protein